jgi:hypothetical protein
MMHKKMRKLESLPDACLAEGSHICHFIPLIKSEKGMAVKLRSHQASDQGRNR